MLTIRVVAAIVAALACAGLAACAQPVHGSAVPARNAPVTQAVQNPPTQSAPPPVTVTVPPPTRSTVYVPAPEPVIDSGAALTPCQQLYVDGFTFDEAFQSWADAGYPANWDADVDGLPCEQSYGEQN